MDRKALSFIALAISMLYGVGFAIVPEDARMTYAPIGGVLVALAWIAVGVLGREERPNRSDDFDS